MKGEIFPQQNKDKLNEIQVQSGGRLGPVFLKHLKHQYLSDTANATWLHKRSLFRNPRKTKWDSQREEKGVILRGLVRRGLCVSSCMMEAKWSWELSEEMLSQIRKWSWQKKAHVVDASCFKDAVAFSKEDWVWWRVSRSFYILRVWSSHMFIVLSYCIEWQVSLN